MPTEALTLDWRLDSPWRRLPWTLPGAVLAGVLILWALAAFMHRPAQRPPEPAPIDAQVIELPPPPTPHKRERPAPPKPAPVIKPKPVAPNPPPPKPQSVAAHPPPVALQKPPPAPVAPAAHAPPVVQPKPPPPPPLQEAPSTAGTLSGSSAAQAILRPMPQIPDEMRDEALEAKALARFHVAPDGSATVELVRATPNVRLNQLLLNALARWRFFPAMRDGKPIASTAEIVVRIEVK